MKKNNPTQIILERPPEDKKKQKTPVNEKHHSNYKAEKTLVAIIAFVIFVLFWRAGFVSKDTAVSIFTGRRLSPTPIVEEPKGFRVIERVPAEDGPSYSYEIRYKFSEPIAPEDFEVEVTNLDDESEIVEIKKVVLASQPNVLWIIPKKPWKYLTQYFVTLTSTNPEKQPAETLKIRYEYLKWEGPVGLFDEEENNQIETSGSQGL